MSFSPASPANIYLYIKLEVAPVHLPGDHALNDLHGNQLEAVVCRAADAVSDTFLDFQVQKPGQIQKNSVSGHWARVV